MKIVRTFRGPGVFLAALVLSGCAAHGTVVVEPEPPVVVRPAQGPPGPPAIPKGHMPPPGQCRIWIPGRPPGHQPKPGNCAELQHRVPPGAYLIRG